MIAIHCWHNADRRAQVLEPQALIERAAELRASGHVLWIDLADPTDDEERLVFEQFLPIHPLSLEDIRRPRREPESPPHFPKVEEFPDYLFVILNPLIGAYLDRLKAVETHVAPAEKVFTQLSTVLTEHVLITHHYQPLRCITELQAFLQRHEAQAERGPDY